MAPLSVGVVRMKVKRFVIGPSSRLMGARTQERKSSFFFIFFNFLSLLESDCDYSLLSHCRRQRYSRAICLLIARLQCQWWDSFGWIHDSQLNDIGDVKLTRWRRFHKSLTVLLPFWPKPPEPLSGGVRQPTMGLLECNNAISVRFMPHSLVWGWYFVAKECTKKKRKIHDSKHWQHSIDAPTDLNENGVIS